MAETDTSTTHCYECMYILDARAAKKDLEGLIGELDGVLKKHDVEIAGAHRWGERRFAYEIQRQKKGYYILYHLKSDPGSLKELKRDFTLFEPLLRQHYLRIETIPETFEFPSDPEERHGRPGGPRDGRFGDRPPRHGDRDRAPERRDGEKREGAPAEGTEKPADAPAEASAEAPAEAATPEAPAAEAAPASESAEAAPEGDPPKPVEGA